MISSNKELVQKVQTYVEQKFVSRASAQGMRYFFPSNGEDEEDQEADDSRSEYLAAQANFFAGAMAALQAVFSYEQRPDINPDLIGISEAMPPKWIFGIMRGDAIQPE